MKYKEIKATNYCIQKLECVCNNCNNKFVTYTAANSELVCFEDKDGKKYFLPSYGKYGYLDLLKKLVEDWDASVRITKSITEKFEKRLKEVTLYDVILLNNVRCPKCKEFDIIICKRHTLFNYPIEWLKIDTEKCPK